MDLNTEKPASILSDRIQGTKKVVVTALHAAEREGQELQHILGLVTQVTKSHFDGVT